MREVIEMRYLWDVPHGVDGSKLERAIPNFRATGLNVAIGDALGEQGAVTGTAYRRGAFSAQV
jgi:hypothetical protein